MIDGIIKWLRKLYNKFLHSIAFLPALMGIAFLVLAILAMEMDAAGLGLKLNNQFKWLTLKDASTARTIVATVAAGIISLTVFSFSMVMIVMNQAASQMSNRMLDNIIGDRVQKIILGFYIGTIVFALFLLTNISETEKAINVPTISVYFLLLLTVFDIFLFIYFLHYITQSFRYEQLIQRIHNKTTETLNKLSKNNNASGEKRKIIEGRQIPSKESGYYQGHNQKQLIRLAEKENIVIEFIHPIGTYVLKGTPLFCIQGEIEEKDLEKIFLDIDFFYGQEIDKNAYYGFFHLTEVAVKALSPGINDPGTAVLSVNALTDLFAQIIYTPIGSEIKDTKGRVVLITYQLPFEELFNCTVLPIWDYGKKDRMVQAAFTRMLEQLIIVDKKETFKNFFERNLNEIKHNSYKL